MLRNMKKLVSLALVFALSASFCMPTLAAEQIKDPESIGTEKNSVISFKDYYKAIKAEYAKYHIKYECTSYDKNFVFTKKLLDQTLEDIEKNVSGLNYDATSHAFIDNVKSPQTTDEKSVNIESIIKPDVASENLNYPTDWTVKSPSNMGSANIRITINADVDIERGRFISMNSCTSRQYGPALNFKSWQQTGSDVKINSDRTWISGYVYGTLVIEYTEPNTGMKVTYTSDHGVYLGITPEAESY